MSQIPYAVDIGAIRGRIFTDGVGVAAPDDASARFPAPDDAARIRAAMAGESIRQSRNMLLLDAGDERLLIDTGESRFNPNAPGLLLPSLRENGVTLDSITGVIITHFHMDHIGGLLADDGAPNFPNARLIASQAEYAHWMNDAVFAALPDVMQRQLRGMFAAYPNQTLIAGETHITPGVTLLPAHGHTPGHTAVLIESGGERLLHVVDSWHQPAQLNVPDARIKYDVQPEQAVSTRRALMDRVEREGLLTLVFHFEFPGLGYVRRDGDRRVWVRQ